MDAARDWLATEGLSRIRRTGYPTLWRRDGAVAPFRTELEVREVGAR